MNGVRRDVGTFLVNEEEEGALVLCICDYFLLTDGDALFSLVCDIRTPSLVAPEVLLDLP